jgi:hypothetical protein
MKLPSSANYDRERGRQSKGVGHVCFLAITFPRRTQRRIKVGSRQAVSLVEVGYYQNLLWASTRNAKLCTGKSAEQTHTTAHSQTQTLSRHSLTLSHNTPQAVPLSLHCELFWVSRVPRNGHLYPQGDYRKLGKSPNPTQNSGSVRHSQNPHTHSAVRHFKGSSAPCLLDSNHRRGLKGAVQLLYSHCVTAGGHRELRDSVSR